MTTDLEIDARKKLWEYLYQDFNVMLLESDLDDIIGLVRNIIKEENGNGEA